MKEEEKNLEFEEGTGRTDHVVGSNLIAINDEPRV
jgi:hypothetical protein